MVIIYVGIPTGKQEKYDGTYMMTLYENDKSITFLQCLMKYNHVQLHKYEDIVEHCASSI